MSRSRVLLAVLFCAALLTPAVPAQASSSLVCSGYSSCAGKGYSHAGYASHQGTMYWRMYPGTNCTNYVAYRLVTTNGMPNVRPKSSVGNANAWGTAMASITNATPVVGSVAWWGRTGHHVAYVEKVVSSTEILVSESNWSGAFDWRRITKSGSGWPDGFIHFKDMALKNTGKPTVSGVVKVGGTLTAKAGTWTPAPTKYSYQWLSDGKAIAGATASTFTPATAQLGHRLSVKVAAARASYAAATVTSAAVTVAAGSLTASTAPAIGGTPRVAELLTATTGTWSPAGTTTFAYQWLAAGVPIPGATSPSFRLTAAQAGTLVSVRVTAARPGYASVASTSKATPVAAGVVTSTSPPRITGTAAVGVPLTASPGTWSASGLSLAYQWLVEGRTTPVSTATSYTPGATDLGHRVTVRVTATRPGFTSATATSSSTTAVVPGTLTARSAPLVSGTAKVGGRVTATAGTWSAPATVSYQWYAGGLPVAGATTSTLVLAPAQLGKQLQVRVIARQVGYTAAGAASALTTPVAAGQVLFSAVPRVTGTPRLGSLVTSDPGTYQPAAAVLRRQWLRDGSPISGATGATHRVTTHDLGRRLSVRLTYALPGYTTRVVTTRSTDVALARSALRAKAHPGRGVVTFVVALRATGLAAPGGTVVVGYGSGRTAVVTLHHGHGTVRLTDQRPGTHAYRFVYRGTAVIAATAYRGSATIR